MVELELSETSTAVVLSDEYGNKKSYQFAGFHNLNNEAQVLLDPIVHHLNRLGINTAKSFINDAKWIDEAFLELNLTNLPHLEDEWLILGLKVHEYIFTTTNHGFNSRSRGRVWTTSNQILRLWQEEEIIPKSVEFPPTRNITPAEIEKHRDQLLGQKQMEIVTCYKLDSLVGSFEISISDDDFLERFQEKLTSSREVLKTVLVDYWKVIKANFEFGQKLIEATDIDALIYECYNYKSMGMPFHPCDLRNGIDGLRKWLTLSAQYNNNFLINPKVRKEWLKGFDHPTPAQTCISINSSTGTKKYGGFGKILQDYIFSDSNLPPNFVTPVRLSNPKCSEHRQAFNWMLGNLSNIDTAVICGLLMMLNPQFTPSAIKDAKVTDKNNKDCLVNLDGVTTFTVDKLRAKQLKTSVLDDISLEIISTVLEMTKLRRSFLKAKGSKAAELLFLPINHRTNKLIVGKSSLNSQLLSGSCPRAVWLGDYYPELVNVGLDRGTVSASKIRTTEGVLEWLRTGSITAMTKKLGNSHKVAIEHYLPPVLLDVWNTRLIRRYQNLWISVAAAGEPFLLEVTDFRTLEELHCFLNDMLNIHKNGSSPLADELHQRFTHLHGVVLGEVDQSSTLHIEVSESNLSVLYTYYLSALTLKDSEVLSRIDTVTKLSPKCFVDIAKLLIHKLPTHNDPIMKQAHFSAFSAAEKWAKKLNWANFMLTGVR